MNYGSFICTNFGPISFPCIQKIEIRYIIIIIIIINCSIRPNANKLSSAESLMRTIFIGYGGLAMARWII